MLKKIAAGAAIMARDLVGLGGAAAITYGAWLSYQPAGYIVGGLLAVIAAVLLARTA